ncbi:MAG TPA: iron-containing redox enzyme family protein [Polyangiaceae bacterium]
MPSQHHTIESSRLASAGAARSFHQLLSDWNRERLSPALPSSEWFQAIARDARMLALEGQFVEQERRVVTKRAAAAPCDPDAFVAWFEALEHDGPGQNDPLFPWLAESAPLEAMRWFLRQEVAGEAGFDDLVAVTQVKLPQSAKLELARNYWDEMGQGHAGGMHGPMLQRLANALGIETHGGDVVDESLALGNLMVALAMNRRYAYHSVGALGAIELTAPGRAAQVNRGLKRLGLGGDVRRYFALHATLDVKHSEAWNREVLRPLVAENPELAPAIAEGALLRLSAGARCFARYRRELGLDAQLGICA